MTNEPGLGVVWKNSLVSIVTRARAAAEKPSGEIADAVKFAQDAQAAAKGLAAAAASENAEQSAASLKMLMATCAGCHGAHREKVEGGFKIKP